MANTMVTIIFQNYYATPIIKLLIRIISDLKVTYKYLLDLHEILYSNKLKDGEYKDEIYFSNFLCPPIIRLLIKVISDLEVNYNYLSDLDEMFHTKQLKNRIVKIIFQISDAMPKLDCSLGYLTFLIFSCLFLGAYLFCDLLFCNLLCLVGSLSL